MQEEDERCIKNVIGSVTTNGIEFYVSTDAPDFQSWTLLNPNKNFIMKKILLMMFAIHFFSFINKTYTQDSTFVALLLVNEYYYTGKPLDSIISILPQNYIEMKVVSGGHQYTARKLRVRYANEVWIELHVRDYTHMNPIDTNRVWNINLMRQENL